jgi:hypothetical protein
MPSKRTITHGWIDIEKLFGIKRWRNDSPFIKEYIKILSIFIQHCFL